MIKNGYYLTIDCGPCRLYQCLVCGQKYAYAGSAHGCCPELKPARLMQYALDVMDLEDSPEPVTYRPRPRRYYPNIISPDRWGHRYRGKKPNLRRLVTVYHKAQANIHEAMRQIDF